MSRLVCEAEVDVRVGLVIPHQGPRPGANPLLWWFLGMGAEAAVGNKAYQTRKPERGLTPSPGTQRSPLAVRKQGQSHKSPGTRLPGGAEVLLA